MFNVFALSGSTAAADIQTFTGYATSIVTWLVSTFNSILQFMLANPICFIGLVVSLVVTAIGTLRHVIGG